MTDFKGVLFTGTYDRDWVSPKTGRIYKVFKTCRTGEVFIPSEYANGDYDVGDNYVISASVIVKDGVGFLAYRVRT